MFVWILFGEDRSLNYSCCLQDVGRVTILIRTRIWRIIWICADSFFVTDQIRVHLPDPYHPRSLLLGEHRFCGFNGLARIAFYNGFNPLSTIKIVNRKPSIKKALRKQSLFQSMKFQSITPFQPCSPRWFLSDPSHKPCKVLLVHH